MNQRPTISERNAANSRAALDQFERALLRLHPSESAYEGQRIHAQIEFSRGVLLELLGAK